LPKRLLLVMSCLLLAVACERERERVDDAVHVRTEIVKRSDFTPSLTLLGVVRSGDTVPIVALTAGTIRYPPRFAAGLQTGAAVHAGELLATIENEKLASAQTQERLRMEAADGDLARAQRSFDQGVLSIAEYSSFKLRAQLAREAFDAAKREARRAPERSSSASRSHPARTSTRT
jgi:multidrug resistance efflux pump